MIDLQDIILRLNEAEEPDQELDEAIAQYLSWSSCPPALTSRTDQTIWFGPNGEEHYKVPSYTASLDAAMEVVPKGAYCKIQFGRDGKSAWCWVEAGNQEVATYSAMNPAIAVCRAALRARQIEDV